MKKIELRVSQAVKMITVLMLGVSAGTTFAASTWTSNFSTLCTGSNGSMLADLNTSATCGGAPNPSLSGWSTGTGTTSNPTAGTTFASARIYDWTSGGLGVVATNENSASTGPHATDNRYGTDAFLVTFGAATSLTSLSIGWNGTDNPTGTDPTSYRDSDLSVFAWTGTVAPTMTGLSLGGMLGAGWKLVGSYMNVGTQPSNTTSIAATNSDASATTLYSSYWLVSAYNSAFGGYDDQRVDAFKLLALGGNTCTDTVSGTKCVPTENHQTPEPSSLALLGAAMMGFVASRRRKQQVA